MGKWTLVLAITLAFGLIGCGEDVVQSVCEPGPRADYPTENIGVTVGKAMENLSLISADGTAFQMSDIYQDSEGRRRLLLISTAAGWCTGCKEEQPALEALYNEHRSNGLDVLVAYFEDESFNPATSEHAQAWTEEFNLSFPVVADPENKFEAYYPGSDATAAPLNMMVDVCTMEILTSGIGFNESDINAVIQAKLPQ